MGIGEEKLTFVLMNYTGLRIGKVEQIGWENIVSKGKQFTMIHIC
jgi:hypothetical protein